MTTMVSFVIPTLNRGRYVVRAVQSCLIAADAFPIIDVEVIVLDSQSDDGSWELLEADFRNEPRVKLAQNRRGLGPTQSWIDGVTHVRGDLVTFVWSDDYVSPSFLKTLAPLMGSGAEVVIGRGAVRDVDDETRLPSDSGRQALSPQQVLRAHFGLPPEDRLRLPVSPTAALFSRKVFDQWLTVVPTWSRQTPLRQDLMWRRAIGPDLLLFLIAVNISTRDIILIEDTVAQFSSHPNSITISSPAWRLRTGYWLARLWALQNAQSTKIPRRELNLLASYAILEGVAIMLRAPATTSETPLDSHKEVALEIGRIWKSRRRDSGFIALVPAALRAVFYALAQRTS